VCFSLVLSFAQAKERRPFAGPEVVNKRNGRKFNHTIPATTDANVRMMGKYNPSVSASHPYYL
jgi:hypothetical protein